MLGELGELFEWCSASVAGWRFIFSTQFRKKVLQRWYSERWYYITLDIVVGVLGIILSIVVTVCLFFWISKVVKNSN
jgi:hypothetical protein